MDARLQYLTTADNVQLYYELWLPDNPRAVIVFLHGLGDHLGRYADFAQHLLHRGYGMCLYDQRGHGKSSGRRGHCRSLADYLRDLSMIIDMVHETKPASPVFLIGHSFGAQIAINFVAKYSKGLRGLVALSPNIEPIVRVPDWKKKFAIWISNWVPIIKIHARVDPKDFSHDESVVDAARADPLMNWHVTARLGAEILKNTAQMPRLAFQVKVPCLFMQGGDDRITSIEATRKFYHAVLVQNKDFKVYNGLYHELLNEDCKEKIFNDIESWLSNQLVSFKRLADGGGHESKTNFDLWHHPYNGAGHLNG